MAGLGYKDFTVGQVLTSAQVDGYLMQQTIMRFASASARTTALSGVLAEGMFSYLDDTNATEYYDGSSWVSISNPGDITAVTAGTGLSGGGTSGSVSLAIDSTVATLTGTQTLTNKTLTTPIISSISNTGTLTLPTSTDTLVGRATTDTLTNKTLTAPVITNPKISNGYSAKTAAYTIASGDEGYLFSMNNAATQQFNIPTDATFNFAIGTEISFVWITGAGQPTIGATTPGTTTVISTGATSATPKLRVVNSAASAIKLSANNWLVVGDLA
jgi:hypothetical protein